ncbi:helix-turn-helix transcriptional regulator [Mucilaginibacter sp.]|uniref:helix-turn-helix domain-containing protein n=1 Tax=Mucilaginibacter sp. TaxID=1882438 RepID=UPI0026003795|nr:helix-turn-helix transcriptional regulator [Mucilaginibacter sp.]
MENKEKKENKREEEEQIFLKKLGERITAIRKEKDVKQVELSSRLNIEKANLSRIEAGNTNPTILMLRKICKHLEIDWDDLLKDLNNNIQ